MLFGAVASQITTPSYIGPLDLVPGAVVAYGQRALSAAKRGTALYTLREDSGNTTRSFNSDATTGDAPVAAINSFLNGANGFVTLWKDQSGNNDVIQATNANQPGWVASIGGKPALAFDGATQWLATASNIVFMAGMTFFFVQKWVNPGSGIQGPFGINDNSNVDGSSMAVYFHQSSGAKLTEYFFGPSNGNSNDSPPVNASAAAFTSLALLDLNIKSYVGPGNTGVDCYLNGVSQTTGSSHGTPLTNVTGPLAIGDNDAGGGDDPFNGNISEVIGYSGTVSDANRLAIRQNIAAWYGITLA